jgi:mRNA interferase MazF
VARVLRGEIWWANLEPTLEHEPSGVRPVLALSHDVFNERSATVIAVALSAQPQKAGFPLSLEIRSASLPRPSWVKISQIRILALERFRERIAVVSDDELRQVVDGLNEIIAEATL